MTLFRDKMRQPMKTNILLVFGLLNNNIIGGLYLNREEFERTAIHVQLTQERVLHHFSQSIWEEIRFSPSKGEILPFQKF